MENKLPSTPRTAPSAVLHVLTGPTAVGKTALALDWAEAHGAVIISCDSLLFYRGMDIGTAKPSPAELARVPHRCVDIVNPADRYSVRDYVRDARRAVDEAAAAGRPVLITGGSGFHLKAFFAPVTDALEIPEVVRAEIDALTEAGAEAARRRLLELEPRPPEWLDLANPRRVLKALERRLTSGRSLEELKTEFDTRPGAFDDFEKKIAVLSRDPVVLEKRIRLRVEIMLRDGLVDEVRRLLAEGLPPNSPGALAIGYRETIAWLAAGEPGGLAALGETIAINTRKLAAKQRKWFRTQLPPHATFDLDAGTPPVANLFATNA